jgi:hypothetical protein
LHALWPSEYLRLVGDPRPALYGLGVKVSLMLQGKCDISVRCDEPSAAHIASCTLVLTLDFTPTPASKHFKMAQTQKSLLRISELSLESDLLQATMRFVEQSQWALETTNPKATYTAKVAEAEHHGTSNGQD